jgi:hypothetical protein
MHHRSHYRVGPYQFQTSETSGCSKEANAKKQAGMGHGTEPTAAMAQGPGLVPTTGELAGVCAEV